MIILPLLILSLFMLMSASSTVSLSLLVCVAEVDGFEGGASLETDISSGAVCFIVPFSVSGFCVVTLNHWRF